MYDHYWHGDFDHCSMYDETVQQNGGRSSRDYCWLPLADGADGGGLLSPWLANVTLWSYCWCYYHAASP